MPKDIIKLWYRKAVMCFEDEIMLTKTLKVFKHLRYSFE